MFDLDPLSRPVAIIEMLLLLTFAAVTGWFLARLLLNGRVDALRLAIADQEAELEKCRRAKITTPAPVASKVARIAPTPPEPTRPAPAPAVVVAVASVPDEIDPNVVNPVLLRTDAPLALEPERAIIDPTPIPPAPVVMSALGSLEDSILQRIAARANELNFDRIGLASASEADDLKDIVGIGPFLERKLHSLGIYTFRQIASFEKEDINKVNEIIEFFPGRIERDHWVDQSKLFHERKYGTKPVSQ